MSDLTHLLREAAGEDCIREQESMKKHTTFRIGGPADYFASPTTAEGVRGILRVCREQNIPYYIIGNGSNLLVSDRGYRGLVLQLYRNFCGIWMEKLKVRDEEETLSSARKPEKTTALSGQGSAKEERSASSESPGIAGKSEFSLSDCQILTAQSGAMLSVIAKRTLDASLTGFEFASGIPGTLGGAVVMNAGAYGGELKDVLLSAIVLTRENELREVPAEKLSLGYRSSSVAANGWIVLGARLLFKPGRQAEIRARMEELKARRLEKQPLDQASAGSTFKRPEGNFAGKLIMDAGLRGFSVGGAQVSEKHCGFVINRGGATAEDVWTLIREVRRRVKENSGVTLEPEIRMLGDF